MEECMNNILKIFLIILTISSLALIYFYSDMNAVSYGLIEHYVIPNKITGPQNNMSRFVYRIIERPKAIESQPPDPQEGYMPYELAKMRESQELLDTFYAY
jgi:hypothetical protein